MTDWVRSAANDPRPARGSVTPLSGSISIDVKEKREAAKRWAQKVSVDPLVARQWAYILASENDVRTANGSWTALKKLAE
jgi:hypothetical protein